MYYTLLHLSLIRKMLIMKSAFKLTKQLAGLSKRTFATGFSPATACAEGLRDFATPCQPSDDAFGPKIKSISSEGSFLEVSWQDGSKSKYPFAWLKDNAPGPPVYFLSTNTSARTLQISDLDLQDRPASVQLAHGGRSVSVIWKSHGQKVDYSATWLQKRNLSDRNFRKNRSSIYFENGQEWGSEEIKKEVQNPANWEMLMSNGTYMADALTRFLKYGLIYVKNVPKQMGMVKKLAGVLGITCSTVYGATFAVRNARQPSSLAYTRERLLLHNDLPQSTFMPSVQVLHAIMTARNGGKNEFVDGFRVANLLKVEQPEVYKILTTVPIEFVDKGRDTFSYSLVYKRPTIQTDVNGKPQAIAFNNALRSWFLDVPVEDIPKVLEALKIFADYCYQPRNLLELQLKPGEMIMFLNRRVLHGRKEYMDTGTDARLLEGGYIHLDCIQSAVRLIQQNFNPNYHAIL